MEYEPQQAEVPDREPPAQPALYTDGLTEARRDGTLTDDLCMLAARIH